MKTIKVWDLFVRIFHWSLVLAILSQLVTAEDFQPIHVGVGYFIIVLLVLRILWGFFGTRHARFTDFIYPPADVLAYLKGLFRRTAARYTGHNPAGGAMVVALLAAVSLTTLTGLLTYGAEGRGLLAQGTGDLVSQALADDDDHDDSPNQSGRYAHDAPGGMHGRVASARNAHFWKEIHESLAGLLVFLAVVHICGVLVSSYAHNENLILAMFTGRKRDR